MYPKECCYSSSATQSDVRIKLEYAYERYDEWVKSPETTLTITLYRLSCTKGYIECAHLNALMHNDYILARRFFDAYQLLDNMISNVMVGKELFNVSERV